MLVLTRKCGQTLIINDNIEITITAIQGDKVKIGIDAPKDIPIIRKELSLTVETNQLASSSVPELDLRKFVMQFNEENKSV